MQGRYEFKYQISLSRKSAILNDAKHGLIEDPHGKNARYMVCSQYFDNSDLVAYWEKVSGEKIRKKFRLRYYNINDNNEISSAYMEIKHRINNTVFKERLKLTDQGANMILRNSDELSNIEYYIEKEQEFNKSALTTIKKAASQSDFAAVNIISYIREAWVGKFDYNFRMTFDTECRALLPDKLFDVISGQHNNSLQIAEAPVIPNNICIMEIKFNNSIPRWARDIIIKHGVRMQRFSKYANGIEVLGLV